MTDDLGRELGAWLRTIDVRPADPATSLRRSMANVERTPQVSRSRLAAVLAREPIPTEPIGDPSIHHHSGRIGQDRPVHVTTRGTSRVFITATAMAVTTAFVLAGSLLLSGTVEGPTDPPIGASPARATESPSPLVGDETGADDLFELTLTAPRTTWSADEPIEFSATLTYIGEEPEVTVIGAGSGLVGFGVEQLDGPVDMEPGWRLSAREYDFAQGDGVDVPFTKSGGFDPEDPMAGFWGSWFDDPELRLPAGEYILSAVASYGLPDAANGLWTEIGAELPIEVVDDPTPPLGASPAPATAVAESPEPTAPVASPEAATSLPVPELGIGSPTMSAERDGLLLEVWLDHTSLPVGGRLNALVRVSNTGTSDVEWQTNICGTGPAVTTIAPARPPDTGVEWTGKAATFKRLLLDNELAPAQLWDASTIDLENVGCDAYSAIRRFEPGSTAEMTVAWDAVDRPGRPIVPGPATVTSTFESWTPRERPAEPSDPSQELVASTTIEIVGEMGPEVPIGRYADIALSDDTFRTWVETRTARPRSWDPYADYWPNDDGTYPDDPRYERATEGTVDIGMFIGNGPRGEVTIDLATLEVLGSKLDGKVKVTE